MAVASVKIECAKCGKLHIWKTVKYNRRDADSWESWARAQTHLCPDCYREEKREEEVTAFANLDAELHFPEIKGISEKQVDYAAYLRSRFCADIFNAERIRKMAGAIKSVNALSGAELAKCEEKVGVTGKDAILRVMSEKIFRGKVYYIILTESNASVLIDALK